MTDQPSPFKSHGGLRRVFDALQYSFLGLKAAIKHEAAFRQELALCIILVPVAFFVGQTLLERVALIAVLLFILIVELMNSAIEALADTITLEHHPLIGRAKDLGSAAVFISFVLAGITWLAVLLDRFLA